MPVRTLLRFVLCIIALLLVMAVATASIWFYRFHHHVTPQEVSHEVNHTMVEALVRGQSHFMLHLYQQANAQSQPLVIFTSGDGGWSPFCADVSAHIAATGKTVVGIDSKTYLTTFASSQKPITPVELRRDYLDFINAVESRPGVDRSSSITLAGWSLGAGYSVLVGSDDGLKDRLKGVVAISLPRFNELAWKPTDALIYITHGTPREKVFEAQEFLKQLGSIPLVMLNATDDDTSPLTESQALFQKAVGPARFFTVTAKGHHFEGGEREFYHDLDESF